MPELPTDWREKLYRNFDGYGYDSQIYEAEGIAHKLLPYVHRGVPDHTGHGIEHSKQVLYYVNELVDALGRNGHPLNRTEIKLLYIAGWLHDIGNVSIGAREKGHSVESCRFIRQLCDTKRFDIGNLYLLLDPIVRYHSSSFDIAEIDDRRYSYDGSPIRMKLLCSIFRLADACDMGERRAYDLVYSLIGDEFASKESKKHWESNAAVISVVFDDSSSEIKVFVTSAGAAELAIERFIKEFESVEPFIKSFLPFSRVSVIEVPDAVER